MNQIAFAMDADFTPPPAEAPGGGPFKRLHRYVWPRVPYERREGVPLCEHFCLLAAAKDPECGRWVVLDVTGHGVIFEVDEPDQIIARADAILTDLIEVSGWPNRGWVLIADVYDSLDALRPWID